MKKNCEKRPEAPVAHYQEHVYDRMKHLDLSEVAIKNSAVEAAQSLLDAQEQDWYGRVDALCILVESVALLSMKLRVPLGDVLRYSMDRLDREVTTNEQDG